MADKIGMKRSWYQNKEKDTLPHYDLVASRRKNAVKLGAIELSGWSVIANKMKELKNSNEWKKG